MAKKKKRRHPEVWIDRVKNLLTPTRKKLVGGAALGLLLVGVGGFNFMRSVYRMEENLVAAVDDIVYEGKGSLQMESAGRIPYYHLYYAGAGMVMFAGCALGAGVVMRDTSGMIRSNKKYQSFADKQAIQRKEYRRYAGNFRRN